MNARTVHLALIGDYNPGVIAHQAIPVALEQAAGALGLSVRPQWLDTDRLPDTLHDFDGFWCVPASPYRDADGALRAIRFAREQRRPFLGTCGGFQHAVLEYARNVMGWADAEHGELAPDAKRAVITPLSCALVETTDTLRLAPYTRISEAYGRLDIEEGYRCRYGMNPAFASALLEGDLIPTGHDSAGDLRAVELLDHPFYVATLFQPERAALKGITPALAIALLQACQAQSA
ncbi:CTP synthase C-terminal region-related (seleno)protein [Pseudomonas lactucae]|uniref:CTP synthase (glutamine hydrolyzing) n=1 Tax=Pseudomonas lactucae TaxID=2813360 RepID=A0A9X0YIX8_9PSED|nr:CTP synthase [Pseudomonas lactucae]MBN2979601.1 CTP synthase [Pseudomonas lactucae]MBN2986921.1 CTP synthase [Pseudomonas lactucae]